MEQPEQTMKRTIDSVYKIYSTKSQKLLFFTQLSTSLKFIIIIAYVIIVTKINNILNKKTVNSFAKLS